MDCLPKIDEITTRSVETEPTTKNNTANIVDG